MTEAERDRLAADWVIGLLDGAEAERCERLAEGDGAFAAAADGWRRRFAELDGTAAPVVPTAELWGRIVDGVMAAGVVDAAVTGAAGAAEVESRPMRWASTAQPSLAARLWDSLGLWRTVGFATAAAALVLAVLLTGEIADRATRPVLVAVLLADADRPAAIVNAYGDGRTELVPIEPVAVPDGRALQVWTLWDRARGPVSVGLIDRIGSLDLATAGLPAPAPDQLYEITLEPAGGSPTGRPTGPILMKGNARGTL